MVVTPRAMVVVAIAAALVAFAIAQDRVTAAGARQYVRLQREALARGATPVAIDQVLSPAVERSGRQGLLWGGIVLVMGLGLAEAQRRRAVLARKTRE